jgi:HAD superfamily hydrolase (TIGR01458 family)
VAAEELFTPTAAAAVIFAERGAELVAPFMPVPAMADLEGVELVGGTSGILAGRRPDAVVIGDLGARWSPALLNEAFRYVLDGAQLLALQSGKYWAGPTGLELDVGAYVAAIEFATDRPATVCGKPERPFFHAVLRSAGLEPPFDDANSQPVMIGDDLWNDVDGAQRAGFAGWLVRTGKFRGDALQRSRVRPGRILDSVSELTEEYG